MYSNLFTPLFYSLTAKVVKVKIEMYLKEGMYVGIRTRFVRTLSLHALKHKSCCNHYA